MLLDFWLGGDTARALVQCVQGMCKDDLPIRPDLRHALEKILSCLPLESQKKVDAGRQAVDIRLARQSVSIERALFQQVEAAIRPDTAEPAEQQPHEENVQSETEGKAQRLQGDPARAGLQPDRLEPRGEQCRRQ